MSDEKAQILDALARLRAGYAERFAAAHTEQSLRDENAKILGKKGDLTAILKRLGSVSPEERKEIGAHVNTLKTEVEHDKVWVDLARR